MGANPDGRLGKIKPLSRGQIWRVAFDPVRGHEQGKIRPAVIVQRDSANAVSPVIIVCPLTDAKGRPGNLLNVFVRKGEGGATKDSLVVCSQIRALDRERLSGSPLGTLSEMTMQLVDQALRAILDL